jgi:chromatin structure-remodeling complex protein RSC7
MLSTLRQATIGGSYNIHTNMMHQAEVLQPTHARMEQVDGAESDGSIEVPPLEPIISRNFFVTDTYMETPPTGISATAYTPDRPAPDLVSSFQGLGAVGDDIKALLPPDCRAAFDEAVRREQSWQARWGPETVKGHRQQPIIDKSIVPQSK